MNILEVTVHHSSDDSEVVCSELCKMNALEIEQERLLTRAKLTAADFMNIDGIMETLNGDCFWTVNTIGLATIDGDHTDDSTPAGALVAQYKEAFGIGCEMLPYYAYLDRLPG